MARGFATFTPVDALSQVVAGKDDAVLFALRMATDLSSTGTNYFVKVALDGGELVHLRIYDRFGTVQLSGIKRNVRDSDELVYFDAN